MSDNDADSSTTFLRQRRDLFVISAILLLIPIAEIKGAESITMPFIGISMHIGKPEVIKFALWILWAYWYVRYIQAYRVLNKSYLRDKYVAEMAGATARKFYELASFKQDQLFKEGHDIENTPGHFGYKDEKYKLFSCERYCEFRSKYNINTSSVATTSIKLTYNGFTYLLLQVKVIMKCLFAHIEYTEYLLPFIFGMAPLLYLIYSQF